MRLSKGEEAFALQCRVLGLDPLREFTFCSGRRWRFDFFFPNERRPLAVEIEGGTWSNGRHVRGASFAKDCDKYNRATMMGIAVLRYTTDMVISGAAVNQVCEFLSEK